MTQRALENQSKQRLPSRNFPCIQAYVTLRTLMLASLTNLSPTEFWIVVLAVFSAGAVRGFAGFALSAILMASVVVILPPVDLIPLAFLLESAASLAMFRGGAKDADMSVVWVLAIGSIIGVPIGLYATVTISPDISKLVALIIVLSLALAQLFRLVPASMGNRAGLAVSGIVAGIVTGLASVGGMVVALYVLSSKAEAKTM
ncbi:MAG: putative membrane protein YfcA, partial [Candidatus Paceibacteria bacterium]